MLRDTPRRAPGHRFIGRLASICAAGLFLVPIGCKFTMPMDRYLRNSPPVPGPLSSGLTPPLYVTYPPGSGDDDSGVKRVSYRTTTSEAASPVPNPLPSLSSVEQVTPVDFDVVMRRTFENNGDLLAARERVRESESALAAAVRSHMPQGMRKDTFKTPVAEATVWRRRVELRKVENEKLLDAANTYFDWLAAKRGESVARDLIQLDEKLLGRARKLVELGEKPAQVMVESAETALEGHRQALTNARRLGQSAATKLALLMGLSGGTIGTTDKLSPRDRVEVSGDVEEMVQRAQANGPGVRELQGLIASIQQGIDRARFAQRICAMSESSRVCGFALVHAPLTCGRLQMAQSELQQARLALNELQGKLRAGVEEAHASIISGREQIVHAAAAIKHAAETYRLMDLRLSMENPDAWARNHTYNGVLSAIQQVSQAHVQFVKAVAEYQRAQARLSLFLGTYSEAPVHAR